jgi:imidazolonepropionase-like amidohydrolase
MSSSGISSSPSQTYPTAEVLFHFNDADKLSGPTNMLVRGNVIERISASPLPVDRSTNVVLIEGNGRTLIPGLIDAHVHLMFAAIPLALAMTADVGSVHQVAGKEAEH